MRLLELGVRGFRNLAEQRLDTDARFVVFHGENAQGKTNLLEAIHVLSTLKAFRARRNRELVAWGAEAATLDARVDDGNLSRRYHVEITDAGRRGEVDGKRPERLGDYFTGVRAVLFSPESVEIVRGGPEERRRFVDRAAFTVSPGFLEVAGRFQRLLDQKGALLRHPAPEAAQLDAFDAALAVAGARLEARRRRLVEELQDPFEELHARIAGGGRARLRLAGRLQGKDEVEMTSSYQALLASNRGEELRRRGHVDGPQRDDLELEVEGRSARAFASQGQSRSVALALKLAELLAARARGVRALFLLDDLSSELDRLRRGRLVELLGELEVQVFVTTTDLAILAGSAEARAFEVRAGVARAG